MYVTPKNRPESPTVVAAATWAWSETGGQFGDDEQRDDRKHENSSYEKVDSIANTIGAAIIPRVWAVTNRNGCVVVTDSRHRFHTEVLGRDGSVVGVPHCGITTAG